MAVDTTLFAADIPAGTFAVGDTIELKCIAGPANVRSGRGAAILKRITCGMLTNISGDASYWKVSVKNSDWIDSADSLAVPMYANTALDVKSGAVQGGHDCDLTPNSSWSVIATCVIGTTTTVANSIWATIDVDYPSVSSITNPDNLKGFPTSIVDVSTGVPINATGNLTTSNWTVKNVDIFKAGYVYAIVKAEMTTPSTTSVGFVSLSNAAGMGGLSRIIPITSEWQAIRNTIEYATSLVKGPMDVKFLLFNNYAATATTSDVDLVLDFVKRRV